MEGYSVTEAASVLGVPTERVWELLARGVLAGAPEGDTGMRVFLQPRPAPAPSPMEMPPPRAADREPERELSPFRELLTEFRNLTERYGQALLALGEARGEVAALRSRVDLLEARMDLRLPAAPAAAGWERPTPVAAPTDRWPESGRTAVVEDAPAPVEQTSEPMGPEPSESAATDGADTADDAGTTDGADTADGADTTDRQARRRRSGHRWSTEDFAEALARAEDPTAPILPAARETAATIAATGSEPAEAGPMEAEAADVAEVLPEPEPVEIEPEPVEPEPIEMAEEPEPASAAGENQAEPASAAGAAETDVAPGGETEAEPPAGEPPAERVADEPEPEPTAAEPAPAAAEPEPLAIEPEPVAELPEPEPEPAVAAAEPEPEPPSAAETLPLDWDRGRYTTEIGEPDWYAEEDEPPSRPSDASATDETPGDSGVASETPPEPVEDDGASEMEIPGRGSPADDLDARAGARFEEALAALDALSRSSPGAAPHHISGEAEPGPATARPEPAAGMPQAGRPVSRPLHHAPTPASRAYRRLRRIFPG